MEPQAYNTDNLEADFLNEPALAYSNYFENKMQIVHIIRKGFSYNAFEAIKKMLPFTDSDWASHLNISLKTLQRNKKEEGFVFKPIHTEKIIELAEVANFGKKVFGDPKKFYLWLKTPLFTLNYMMPVDLLSNSYGKEMVMGELNKIEHGIFV